MVVYMEEDGRIVTASGNSLSGFPYHSVVVADGDDLNRKKAEKKFLAKKTAREKILAQIPQWKQHNLTARALELVRKELLTTITPTETTELNALNDFWTGLLCPIRTASDAIEAEVEALTAETIDAYNSGYGNPLWP